MPLGALALAAAPLQAASPQESFAQLAQPAQALVAKQYTYSAATPALSLLPQQTEGMVVIPRVGEHLSRLMKNSCRSSEKVQCLDSAALSLSPGSAETLRTLLTLAMHAQLVDRLEYMGELWLSAAKPEYEAAIKGSFDASLTQCAARLKQAVRGLHIPPIYAALTAASGKDAEFEAFYQEMTGKMAADAASPKAQRCGLKPAEVEGYTGLEMPRAALLRRLLMPELRQEPDVAAALNEGSIYLLTKKQGNAILLVLCSDPAEISLPASAAESLSNASALQMPAASLPELPGADPLGVAWLAPAVIQAYALAGQQNDMVVLADTVASTFDKLAAEDAANAPAYAEASAGVKRLTSTIFPQVPEAKVPATLTAWQTGDEVHLQFDYDAMGLHYEPGELRTASLSDAAETILYAESTAVSSPYVPKTEGCVDSCTAIARGLTLTTVEGVQDEIAPRLMMVEAFAPELAALGEAASTVMSGLTAPCSLVLSHEPSTPNPMLPPDMTPKSLLPAIAFASGVKDRAALGEGWQKLVAAVQQGTDKLGGPQNIVSMLPVVPRVLGGSAVNYVLALPLLPGVEPQLTVSDKNFVLSTHTGLNNKMLALESSPAVPFCGFAARVNFAPLAQLMLEREANSPTSLRVGVNGCDKSPWEIVRESVSSVSATQVENSGVVSFRWCIQLAPAAAAEPEGEGA